MAVKYWEDSHRTLYLGDARNMAEIPDESVQMVVTSPPYWGLRKYSGLPDSIWGGDENCEHQWGKNIETGDNRFRAPSGSIVGGNNNPDITKGGKMLSSFCSLCGGWKGQLGLEPTPELYIQYLVEIFREVKRVLRKDGVVFINCGDSYFGGGNNRGNKSPISDKQASNSGAVGQTAEHQKNIGKHPILKPKDLCLIPFRVAIAAQEDGWWVRSVIIWNKPNPMPESVRDRPTESHEYILMLTKSAKYYYDQEAVRTRQADVSIARMKRSHSGYDPGYPYGHHNHLTDYYTKFEGRPIEEIDASLPGANLKSVWTFPTQGYPEAHFATYPEELVRRCVKAATPEVGCCPKCGKPWARIIKPNAEYTKNLGTWTPDTDADPELRAQIGFQAHGKKVSITAQYDTIGWKPQCKCGLPQSENVPSIVLDPFCGSGTTLLAAAELSRRAIGYELSEQYVKLAIERNRQGVMG